MPSGSLLRLHQIGLVYCFPLDFTDARLHPSPPGRPIHVAVGSAEQPGTCQLDAVLCLYIKNAIGDGCFRAKQPRGLLPAAGTASTH